MAIAWWPAERDEVQRVQLKLGPPDPLGVPDRDDVVDLEAVRRTTGGAGRMPLNVSASYLGPATRAAEVLRDSSKPSEHARQRGRAVKRASLDSM